MTSRAMPRPNFQFSVLSLPFAILLACAAPAFPQATFPSPVLTSISPLAAKHSSTVEMTLRGSDLDAPLAVLLSSEKAIASHLIPVQEIAGKANVVRFKLPNDTVTTYYDIRFVGRYGVSNPRGFLIHLNDEIESPGTNTKREKALKVALNSVIQGSFKAATPHWFSFEAQRGRHVLLGFFARHLDVRTELVGTVLDSAGHEVGRLNRGDLSFVAPESDNYFLRLNDLMYRAGDDYGFCVTTASMPAFSEKQVISQNRHEVIGQAALIRDTFSSTPHTFDLPFKTGDRFVIEVHSHQLGHPADPHLVIENLKPDGSLTPQAEIADAPAITPAPSINLPNRDPSYAYEAKADGAFRISLSDNFNTASPFELRVFPASDRFPDLNLIAINPVLPGAKTKGAEIGSANVPRNGITAFEVIAPNRNALSEPIELKAENMPAGVTCLGGFIGKGQSLGYIAFQAAADAPAGASILGGILRSRFVSFALPDMTKGYTLYRTTGAPALGVSTQAAPALIQTETTDIFEVAADAKLEIPLKVTRHAEFTDAIKLTAIGLIDATKAPAADIPAKAVAGKFTLDVKALKLAPGDYGFILQGPAKMKVRRNLEELHQAEIDAKKALGSQKDAQKSLDSAKADTTPKKAELVKAATEALKAADKAKTDIDKLVKDLTVKATPKEAIFIVYSNPIRIRVKDVAKK